MTYRIMKKFFNITSIVAALLMISASSTSASAQAFDADYDFKIFTGYLNKGGKSGIQIGAEYGRSRFFSFGGFVQGLFGIKDEDGESNFFKNTDLQFRCNFHWTDVMHLPSTFDIYTGVNVSLRAGGLQAGVRYNFSERFGLYGEVQQPLFKTFSSGDFDNRYFNKKFGFSAGFTINL